MITHFRILNRFSSDIDVLDLRIPMEMGDALFCLANTLAVIVTIAANVPAITAFFIPIIGAGAILQVTFLHAWKHRLLM